MSAGERTKLSNSPRKYGSSGTKEVSSAFFVNHEVKPTDTLAGLAIKYGVQKEQIMQVNKLFSADSMFSRKVLRIPVHEDPHASSTTDGGDAGGDTIEPAMRTPKAPERPAQVNDIFARMDKVLSATKADVERRDHKFTEGDGSSPRTSNHPNPKLKTVPAFVTPAALSFGKTTIVPRYAADNEGLLDEENLFEL